MNSSAASWNQLRKCQATLTSAYKWKIASSSGASRGRYSNTGTWASNVCAQAPGLNARGCRSRLQPFASRSLDNAPEISKLTRPSVTSETRCSVEPHASAARSVTEAAGQSIIAHCPGAIHNTVRSPCAAVVLGSTGQETSKARPSGSASVPSSRPMRRMQIDPDRSRTRNIASSMGHADPRVSLTQARSLRVVCTGRGHARALGSVRSDH